MPLATSNLPVAIIAAEFLGARNKVALLYFWKQVKFLAVRCFSAKVDQSVLFVVPSEMYSFISALDLLHCISFVAFLSKRLFFKMLVSALFGRAYK